MWPLLNSSWVFREGRTLPSALRALRQTPSTDSGTSSLCDLGSSNCAAVLQLVAFIPMPLVGRGQGRGILGHLLAIPRFLSGACAISPTAFVQASLFHTAKSTSLRVSCKEGHLRAGRPCEMAFPKSQTPAGSRNPELALESTCPLKAQPGFCLRMFSRSNRPQSDL